MVNCVVIFNSSGSVCLQVWYKKKEADKRKAFTANCISGIIIGSKQHVSGTFLEDNWRVTYKRFKGLYILAATESDAKEWSTLKKVDSFYTQLMLSLNKVTEENLKKNFDKVFATLETCFEKRQTVLDPSSRLTSEEIDPAACRAVMNNVKKDIEVGKIVFFMISTVGAGKATLTAKLEQEPSGTSLPLQIEQLTETLQRINFQLAEPGEYWLSVYYNGKDIEGSPFCIMCSEKKAKHDMSQCKVVGAATAAAKEGKQETFKVYYPEEDVKLLDVHIENEDMCLLPLLFYTEPGVCTVQYTIMTPGEYMMTVKWHGKHFNGSPFKIVCHPLADPSKYFISKELPKFSCLGVPVTLAIESEDEIGKENLEVMIKEPSQALLQNSISIEDQKSYKVSFTPVKPGPHIISCLIDGSHMPRSPFKIKVFSADRVIAKGPGLLDGSVGQKGWFLIDASDAGEGNLVIVIHGPKGGFKLDMKRDPENKRRVTVTYDPILQGSYLIDVQWSGFHIPGSPFNVIITQEKSDIESIL